MKRERAPQEFPISELTTYEKWLEKEGLEVITGLYIEDLKEVPLKPWKRKGGYGAFINLFGSNQTNGAYLCEIPPGKKLKPQKHLFEEYIYILQGQGSTRIWNGTGLEQIVEWQEGNLFSPPLNSWHRHSNIQKDKVVRYVAVTNAPLLINLFHNLDFVFKNKFNFKDRYRGEKNYFSSRGKSYPFNVWESNFISEVRNFPLQEWRERGSGAKSIFFEVSHNTMVAHISEFPVGRYKKAHRHGPGAHIIILKGKGHSYLWPEGEARRRIDWKEGSLIVPPANWYHQHFNTSAQPARYLGIHRGGSIKYRMGREYFMGTKIMQYKDKKHQIEYEEEDPEIRRIFEEELKKSGVEMKMPLLIR